MDSPVEFVSETPNPNLLREGASVQTAQLITETMNPHRLSEGSNIRGKTQTLTHVLLAQVVSRFWLNICNEHLLSRLPREMIQWSETSRPADGFYCIAGFNSCSLSPIEDYGV